MRGSNQHPRVSHEVFRSAICVHVCAFAPCQGAVKTENAQQPRNVGGEGNWPMQGGKDGMAWKSARLADLNPEQKHSYQQVRVHRNILSQVPLVLTVKHILQHLKKQLGKQINSLFSLFLSKPVPDISSHSSTTQKQNPGWSCANEKVVFDSQWLTWGHRAGAALNPVSVPECSLLLPGT